MSGTLTTLDPRDNGRRMTLDEFDQAHAVEGSIYELSRGIVTVTEVPGPRHLFQVNAIRKQFAAYDSAHAGRIFCIASGGECKIMVSELQSERHPDVAVYLQPPPEDEDVWSTWIPEIVVEVVSPSSSHRDYEEKPDEYLKFGIREYWIIDADRQHVLILKRSRGKWAERTLPPGEKYRTPLLPGFRLDCAAVFAAAAQAPR